MFGNRVLDGLTKNEQIELILEFENQSIYWKTKFEGTLKT